MSSGRCHWNFKKLGHDVRVVIPKYASNIYLDRKVSRVTAVHGSSGWAAVCEWCSVQSVTTECGVPVYLIEHNYFLPADPVCITIAA